MVIAVPHSFAGYEPVYAKYGMVVSPEPNATRAGLEILKQGGNAFDAAVTVGFAISVTHPQAGNLGGGGFMVAYTAGKQPLFLNYREKAPQAAYRDMYLDADGNVIPDLSTDSLLAVGVPGTVHGLLTILKNHGTLDRATVLQPAIDLAERGFRVPYSLEKSLRYRKKIAQIDSTRAIFFPDGEPLSFDSLLVQRDLAETLTAIQQHGIAGFYEGQTADRIADYMTKHGGIITRGDLKNYTSQYRDPIEFDYKDYHFISTALPSSGGITMGQILKLVEPLPLREMGYLSSKYIHTLVEAERLAYADRNYFLGDQDFADVPVATLLSPEYLAKRRALMPEDRAGASSGVAHGDAESEETTHFCVADRDGNVVAITTTLNGSFGMGAVVEGAGFFLNNEMDDFSAKPGEPNMFGLTGAEANAIEPGKRMLSSMTPTIVTQDGEFKYTFGTPGGATIITTNVQTFLNLTEFGMNIREAIDRPRFHHQWLPGKIDREPRAFSSDTERALEAMGYKLDSKGPYGCAAGIQRMDNGLLAGYADGRGEGLAAGY